MTHGGYNDYSGGGGGNRRHLGSGGSGSGHGPPEYDTAAMSTSSSVNSMHAGAARGGGTHGSGGSKSIKKHNMFLNALRQVLCINFGILNALLTILVLIAFWKIAQLILPS